MLIYRSVRSRARVRRRVGELGDAFDGLSRKERFRRADIRAEELCCAMAVSSETGEEPREGAMLEDWDGVV